MIDLSPTLTPKTQAVLDALRNASEGEDLGPGGILWGSVYVDNGRPSGMPERAFAGHLSVLTQAGLYRPETGEYAGVFGYVAMLEEVGS